MKKSLIVGIILFSSIALNVTLGSMLAVRHHTVRGNFAEGGRPMLAMMKQLRNLPEEQRTPIKEIVQQTRPELRAAMEDVRDTRQQISEYLKDKDYNREEAEKKLASLREKTSAMQLRTQIMMLDIADNLTPEQRAEFFKRKGGNLP